MFHVGMSGASIAEKYATRYLQSQNDTKMNVFHGIYLYLPLNHQINYSPPRVKFVNIINFTSTEVITRFFKGLNLFDRYSFDQSRNNQRKVSSKNYKGDIM